MDIDITKLIVRNAHSKAAQLSNSMHENSVLYKLLIDVYGAAIIELRTIATSNSFDTEEEEIYFFKHCKTELFAHYSYYIKLLDLYSECINLSPKEEIKKHSQQRKQIRAFRRENLHVIKYFEKKATHLDKLYFTRNGIQTHKNIYASLIQCDVLFTTSQDFILGKYMALMMLDKNCRNRIQRIKRSAQSNERQGRLHWKKSKVALVELLTSIYKSGSVEEDFTTIIEEFEIFLGINKLDAHNKYSKIKNRNNPTQYLDELKSSITNDIKDYFEKD
jgi:hypothetical protein